MRIFLIKLKLFTLQCALFVVLMIAAMTYSSPLPEPQLGLGYPGYGPGLGGLGGLGTIGGLGGGYYPGGYYHGHGHHHHHHGYGHHHGGIAYF